MAYKRASAKERYRPKSGRLLDQVREVIRYHHYAYKTEQAYVRWIVRYIRFNDTQHPLEMGKHEIERFLSHLALNRNVTASTQNQALNAILFLYREVLDRPIDDRIEAARSRKGRSLPTVLSRAEVKRLIEHTSNDYYRLITHYTAPLRGRSAGTRGGPAARARSRFRQPAAGGTQQQGQQGSLYAVTGTHS